MGLWWLVDSVRRVIVVVVIDEAAWHSHTGDGRGGGGFVVVVDRGVEVACAGCSDVASSSSGISVNSL